MRTHARARVCACWK